MAETSRAWVMDVGAAGRVAAGERHVAEYLVTTDTVPLPRTRPHCVGLVYWRDRYIPVIDLAPLYGSHAGDTGRRAVILAYQNAPGETLQYGALVIHAAPVEAWVSNDMATEVPTAPPAVRHISRACFLLDDKVIPILDVRRLFAQAMPAAVFTGEGRPLVSNAVGSPAAADPDREPVQPTDSDLPPPGPDTMIAVGEVSTDESKPPVAESMNEPAADAGTASPAEARYGVVTAFSRRRSESVPEFVSEAELNGSFPQQTNESSDAAAHPAEKGAPSEQRRAVVPPVAKRTEPVVVPKLAGIYSPGSKVRGGLRPARRRRLKVALFIIGLAIAGAIAWATITHYRPAVSHAPTRTKAPAIHHKKTAKVRGSTSAPGAPTQPPK